ncbi:hypothetical protein PM082_019188 [Marasmius tenuissimus]|nr:hypothetical protein PM082_019188 [Marasmius tenuissimus]
MAYSPKGAGDGWARRVPRCFVSHTRDTRTKNSSSMMITTIRAQANRIPAQGSFWKRAGRTFSGSEWSDRQDLNSNNLVIYFKTSKEPVIIVENHRLFPFTKFYRSAAYI